MYNYKQKAKNKTKLSRNKKILLVLAITLLTVGLISGVYAYKNRNSKTTNEAASDTGQTVDYSPPTDEEKKEVADRKEEIVKKVEQIQNNTAPTSGKATVKPTITNTTGSINAYISGIFEEGGTCTATFTKGSTVLTKTSTGFQNVSYTQCAPMNLEVGFLSSGNWTVVVKYSSDKSEGSSDPQTIEVK